MWLLLRNDPHVDTVSVCLSVCLSEIIVNEAK